MYANKWGRVEEGDKALKKIQDTKTESERNRKHDHGALSLIGLIVAVRNIFEDSPFEPFKCLSNKKPFSWIYYLCSISYCTLVLQESNTTNLSMKSNLAQYSLTFVEISH